VCYPDICLEGLRKTIKNLSQDNRSSDQYLNLWPPEYEAGVLTTWWRRSVQRTEIKSCNNVDIQVKQKNLIGHNLLDSNWKIWKTKTQLFEEKTFFKGRSLKLSTITEYNTRGIMNNENENKTLLDLTDAIQVITVNCYHVNWNLLKFKYHPESNIEKLSSWQN
jgi:hypothetical protein